MMCNPHEMIQIPIVHRIDGNLAVVEGIPKSDSNISCIQTHSFNEDGAIISNTKCIGEQSMIIALKGSVRVGINNGHYLLNKPNQGILFNTSDKVLVSDVLSPSLLLQVYFSSPREAQIPLQNTRCVNPESSSIVDCQEMTVESWNQSFTTFQTPIVQRLYYLYGIPSGAHRGGHSHRKLHQLLLCVMGSFDLTLSDGINSQKIRMKASQLNGIAIVPGIWRELENFSEDAICLVLATEKYSESDYIRNMQDFRRSKKV